MIYGSLFGGIGGFDLAAEWMGWENKFHCERNPFGQKVLKHYWPNAESFNDITKTDFTKYANRIDILTGGFPCQPYSLAGKRKGKEDERHLWPEMLRAVREISPRWVVGENVFGLINWNGGLVFDEVQTDLETAGYEVQPYVLPACAVNAPHRRDRVWFVAHRNHKQRERKKGRFQPEPFNGGSNEIASDTESQREQPRQQGKRDERRDQQLEVSREGSNSFDNGSARPTTNPNSIERSERRLYSPESKETERHFSALYARSHRRTTWQNFPTQSPVCNGDDGLSSRLDGITFSKWRNESIKAAGNAIVPQVALQIFRAIEQYESINNKP